MASILFAWELGGGLGHVMQLRPLAEGLIRRGHRVVLALRDLSRAQRVFGREGVEFLQAPVKTYAEQNPFALPMTFAHTLHNMGFSSAQELWTMTQAWSGLYDYVRPRMIIFDHAPTALLAARGLAVKRVVIGSGFCIPVDESPLPNLRRWIKVDAWKLRVDEQGVLDRMNQVLAERKQPALERITQLYSQVDETLLLTYRELDHYPNRQEQAGQVRSGEDGPVPVKYWGAWTKSEGKRPQWPGGSGPKIYAYLKDFPALPELLGALKELGNPAIVLVDGIAREVVERFRCEHIAFSREAMDMGAVASECDLAILNAGHGTTAAMLLAGKPILQIPIYLEQAMLAEAVRRMGAGLCASNRNGAQIVERLREMLGTERYRARAAEFAARYARLDAAEAKKEMTGMIDDLLNDTSPVIEPRGKAAAASGAFQ